MPNATDKQVDQQALAPGVSNPEIVPVIVGGDVGVYTLGLECYEAFGVKSICVAAAPVDMITKSVLFDVESIPSGAKDDELLAVLLGIAATRPGARLVLLANTDKHIEFFARHREELEKSYLLPVPSTESIELLCSKESFAQVCSDQNVPTPSTVTVDFSGSDDPDWAHPEVPFQFPVVAKAASASAYDGVKFEGKKKIWFVEEESELTDLWEKLREAGFKGKFLVQENIPGDDTYMRSLTFYVSADKKVLLRSGAHVLLQDPAPTMIGNPVAMITKSLPELWEMGERILRAGNYSGFANFDIKVDPRDGTPYFLEVNPRIGRNSYYVVGAGVNPMIPMVEDLSGKDVTPVVATEPCLYTLVSMRLIREYVTDPALVEEAEALADAGLIVNPLESPSEPSRTRRLVARLQQYNYQRKFKRYYPHIKETAQVTRD